MQNQKTTLSCLDSVKRKQNNKRPTPSTIAIVSSCIDRSTSMETFQGIVAKSLVDFIEQQKQNSKDNNIEVIYNLTMFDTVKEHIYEQKSIHDISLTLEEASQITEPRGLTNLFTTAISELETLIGQIKEIRNRPETQHKDVKGIFYLFTDGMDNQSTLHNHIDLKNSIRIAESENITCIFAAANQDALSSGDQYGFDTNNCLSMNSEGDGATMGLRACSQAVGRVISGQNSGFTQLERETSVPIPIPIPLFRSQNTLIQTHHIPNTPNVTPSSFSPSFSNLTVQIPTNNSPPPVLIRQSTL